MELLYYVLLFIVNFFAPVFLIALALLLFFLWRRGARLKKSLGASRGDETAMQLERLRFKATLARIGAGVAGLGVFCAALANGASFVMSITFGLLGWALPSFYSRSLKKQYNTGFKETFVASELAKVFANLDYQPAGTFDADTLQSLGFFKSFEALAGSDLITADYRGIRFTQSDVALRERLTGKDAEGDEVEHWATLFAGRAMRFDFATPFRGDVQVVKRNFEQARVTRERGAWQTVETELAEFGEDYRVFARDPLDAMAVLTPQMIEGIYYLEQALRLPMAFYFTGHSMFAFIALTRDAFDTSGKKTLLEERELLRKDIVLVTDFLETMYFRKQEHTAAVADVSAGGPEIPMSGIARRQQRQPGNRTELRALLQRTGYKLRHAAASGNCIVIFLPLVLYLASIVYMVAALPDDFFLGVSIKGDEVSLSGEVPTLAYIFVASFFIIPSALAGGGAAAGIINTIFSGSGNLLSIIPRLFSMLVIMVPCWIHLLFFNVNMSYR